MNCKSYDFHVLGSEIILSIANGYFYVFCLTQIDVPGGEMLFCLFEMLPCIPAIHKYVQYIGCS